MNKHTRSFLEYMLDNECVGYHWGERSEKIDKTIEYLDSLSKSAIRQIVSDPYWNRYPSYKHYVRAPVAREVIRRKPFGSHLRQVFRKIFDTENELSSLLIRHSQGLFLAYTMDNISGKDRLRVARRARRSMDSRVRKRAAKILPVSQLNELRFDSDSSIKRTVINRIGIDNCAKDYINDKNRYLQANAIEAAPLNSFNYKEHLDNFLEFHMERKLSPWAPEVRIVKSIIKRMDPEELLVYINLSGKYKDIDDILYSKFNN